MLVQRACLPPLLGAGFAGGHIAWFLCRCWDPNSQTPVLMLDAECLIHGIISPHLQFYLYEGLLTSIPVLRAPYPGPKPEGLGALYVRWRQWLKNWLMFFFSPWENHKACDVIVKGLIDFPHSHPSPPAPGLNEYKMQPSFHVPGKKE